MQSLSRTFRNLLFVRCMNTRQFWMKNRINPQVFILFNFFLHLSTRFPNNHPQHLLFVPFLDYLSIDLFDQQKFCCSCDQKCFRSTPHDKGRLRCNKELILVCMFHWFPWSNQFHLANLSTFRPSRFTSPCRFRNPFCPFLPDFCTMRPLWIRFPYVVFLQNKIICPIVLAFSGHYRKFVRTHTFKTWSRRFVVVLFRRSNMIWLNNKVIKKQLATKLTMLFD